MGFFSKIGEGLKKTRDSLLQSMNTMLHSFTRIDEELFEELEEILIMGDVGAATAGRICEELRRKVKERGETDPGRIQGLLEETVAELLRGGQELELHTKPAVILVIGVNGVGKTTTIGKLGARLKADGKRVLFAAADTFRAAAADQLEIWSERSGADLVRQHEGADPAAVVFDAMQASKARKADVVLVDTAGRLHNKQNLMNELNKIGRVIDRELPDSRTETLLVLDATTGQNGLIQAKQFMEAAGITGIVLTKLDGSAKGGIVFAIAQELGVPVKFVGVGEGIDDLMPFEPDAFVRALI